MAVFTAVIFSSGSAAEGAGPKASGPTRTAQAGPPPAPFAEPRPLVVPEPVESVPEVFDAVPVPADSPLIVEPSVTVEPYRVPSPAAGHVYDIPQPPPSAAPPAYGPTACVEDACDGTGSGCESGCGCPLFGGELGEPFAIASLFACGGDDCVPAEPCVTVGGWISAGYHSESTGLFNTRPDAFNWHQVWLYAERVADGSDGLGFGFRADVMYGQDAGDTQAFGNPPGSWDYENGWDRGAQYGFAMPQAYVEAAYGDLSVIAGHFYTLLGYEVVTAPDNFFYSHAFTMFNSEAFTHTGALATYAASDDLTLYGGYTFGWDTGFDRYDLDGQNGSSFLGGFSYVATDSTTATFITTFGDFGAIGDGYSHSLVIDTAVTDRLNYVFQTDLLNAEGIEEDAITGAFVRDLDVETVGINQYLLYALSDRVGLGTRVEWWKNDSDSVVAITGGVNIRPCANFVLRPEIRYQTDPGAPNAGVESDDKAIFGIDGVLTF